jgi:hypothetical protein
MTHVLTIKEELVLLANELLKDNLAESDGFYQLLKQDWPDYRLCALYAMTQAHVMLMVGNHPELNRLSRVAFACLVHEMRFVTDSVLTETFSKMAFSDIQLDAYVTNLLEKIHG